jgi:hypothetical protein
MCDALSRIIPKLPDKRKVIVGNCNAAFEAALCGRRV